MTLNNSGGNNNLPDYFESIKADLLSYIEKKAELYKLKTFEKVAVSGSFIAYSLVVLLLIGNIIFFSLLALGFFLGECLGSAAAGFGILILITVLILAVFMFMGKKFRRFVINLFISVIAKIESNEE